MRSDPMAVIDDQNSLKPFYHGTKADLKPGTLEKGTGTTGNGDGV